ncbi:MAG: ABC transporter substrate-binding protein [Alphaproteobacteria bacterium]|nr:ABC transporter substrate-binding protein [Alphaproteobacteria bacterium]
MRVARTAPGKIGRAIALFLALGGSAWGEVAAALPHDGQTGAQESVRGFYRVLLMTMKNARTLGQGGRYAALAPIVNSVFDVPSMARLAVGPTWDTLTPTQQQRITTAFGRYVSATYADRFNSYSGQQLEVTGGEPYAGGVIVETKIIRAGQEPVTINYMMRQHQGAWQISDVYLDGTISQLATQRSEFHSILVRDGVEGLISALARKVDLLTSNTPRSP